MSKPEDGFELKSDGSGLMWIGFVVGLLTGVVITSMAVALW